MPLGENNDNLSKSDLFDTKLLATDFSKRILTTINFDLKKDRSNPR